MKRIVEILLAHYKNEATRGGITYTERLLYQITAYVLSEHLRYLSGGKKLAKS